MTRIPAHTDVPFPSRPKYRTIDARPMTLNCTPSTTASAAIHRYFEIALYLLLATGFGTLAATGTLDTPTVILVGGAFLLRGGLLWQRRTMLIPDRWTSVLTLGYVAFYLADYFLLSGSFLKATVHLVLFVMVVRLFSTQRDRDYYFLSVLSFLMVLAAAVLTVHGIFLLAFAAFTLTSVVTFILMEMRRASADSTIQSKSSGETALQRRMGLSLFAVSPAIMFFILLGAAAIFFVLPRISSGYLTAYAPSNEISTGFSDHVRLGQIGQIQQSNALVMHIKIDSESPGPYPLKWRGVALNLFDGKTWSNPHDLHILPPTWDGSYILWPGKLELAHAVPAIHYRVLMEPIGTNVFFLAPTPLEMKGDYRLVAMDEGGAVFDVDPEHPVTAYTATSSLRQPAPADLRLAYGQAPPAILLNDLQLPRLDPRIPRLAVEVTASSNSNYAKAAALESYLQSHYGYTLQLSRTPPRDPLAEFLFVRKQGHCEYFASSMAVMLRTLRIPSRVVNGFRGGQFNHLTGQYIVRASDAHSWVEAYFPGNGWISFDPTPASPLGTSDEWGRAALYLDALASFWREWVVNYDVSHQAGLARDAVRDTRQWFVHLRQWANKKYEALMQDARHTQTKITQAPQRWTLFAVVIAALVVLLATAGKIWRAFRTWRQAARPDKSPGAAATIWYLRMTRRLHKRGWPKLPTQTPQEFADGIGNSILRERVVNFTQIYESARFGESVKDAVRLPELYEEIANTQK